MKVTLSPLVAGLSGKAADAVAASWKGRQYVRKFVVPANPKSAGQVTQRGYLSRMAKLYRSLDSNLKTLMANIAVGDRLSAYNMMTKLDLKHLAAAEAMGIVRANPNEDAVFSNDSVVGATNTKEIDAAWTPGSATATHYVHLFTAPVDPAEAGKEQVDQWTYHDSDITLVSAAAVTLTLGTADKEYHVVLVVADTNDLATATVISGGVGLKVSSKV